MNDVQSRDPVKLGTRLPLCFPLYEDEVQKALVGSPFKSGLAPDNLRLSLLNDPNLFLAFQSMAGVLLFKGSLPAREREIAIIWTGALTLRIRVGHAR